MYVQFFNSLTQKQVSSWEVRKSIGLDPETVGPEALSRAGIFPIKHDIQPHNTRLYDIQVSWDTSTGYAVKTWSSTSRALSVAVKAAKEIRTNTAASRIRTLKKASGSLSEILDAADGIDDLVRPARFDFWTDRINACLVELDTDLASIENATTVDQINDIVSAAEGMVKLAVDKNNPLNFLGGDFSLFNSRNYAKSELELYFTSTDTTVAYSSGFPATNSAVTENDRTVQLRVASTGVVVDEFELGYATSINEATFVPFGYKSGYERPFIFTETDEIEVTVSNGVFYIDGTSQKSLRLTQGRYYHFKQDDASNSGHPIKFYTGSDKAIEVVARVAHFGTPGTPGAYTEFIPGKAGTFSYQCENHDGMGGKVFVLDTYGRLPDAFGNFTQNTVTPVNTEESTSNPQSGY